MLGCDTIFDAFARAELSVAIVAADGSSIALIFRNRTVDYFIEGYDEAVAEAAGQLIDADEHDLILAYQKEYDDRMHATVPRSEEALREMRKHVRVFHELATVARARGRRARTPSRS